VFARLLAESLRRGRRRKLLALAAVAVGTAGSTALGSLLLAAGDGVAAELLSYGANLEMRAAGTPTLPAASLGALRRIFWRNNIVAVAPFYPVRVRVEAPGRAGEGPVVPLLGTWFDVALDSDLRTGLPRVRPTLPVAGRWPLDAAAEVAAGRRVAARLGLEPGARVSLVLGERREEVVLVGTIAGGGEEEEQLLVPLAVALRLAGRSPASGGDGEFARAEIAAVTAPETDFRRRDPRRMTPEEYDRWYCTAYPSAIAHQIEEAVPGSRVDVVRSVAGAAGVLGGRLRVILILAGAVVVAGAVVGTGAATAATVLERRVEVGLLGALGAERHRVALFLLSESVVVGAAGGLLGGAVGLAAGRWLGQAVFELAVPWQPAFLPLGLAAGVAVAVAGSLPALARVLVSHPASLLKRAAA
jgi:putative ABC transport system permease protein